MEENMPSGQVEDKFVVLVQRLMRVRPKLAFSDENMASLKRQMRELRESGSESHEDMAFMFRIPILLSQRETPPTMGELSSELGIPLSSATRMADWLVKVNIAERCSDARDRRIVRLCITDHGRELIQLSTQYMKARISQLLRHFSDEDQKELLRLMNKLVDSIEAEE
jgi:DNA-binding MarR family transcriptional regulator